MLNWQVNRPGTLNLEHQIIIADLDGPQDAASAHSEAYDPRIDLSDFILSDNIGHYVSQC
jgi:hypothetical protein